MNGKQLKNSILQWAIQGKLVPQDPNDEPASELLRKIREEKARLVKEGKIKKDKNESIIYRGDDNSHYEKLANGEVRCIDSELPFEIPNGWLWCRIKNVFSMQAGKFVSASDIQDEQAGEYHYPCYGGNGLRGYVKKYNNDGDFTIVGRQGALCGNVQIVSGKFYATEHAVVTDGYGQTNVKWAFYFLTALNLNQYATATAQPGLAVSNILEVLLPLPPLSEQHRIVEKLEGLLPLIKQYDLAQTQLDTLNNEIYGLLKKSILQEAIQGKVVPQCVTDEPASKLLERIKDEKRNLVKAGKLKAKDIVDSVIFKGEDNKYYEKCGKSITDIDEDIPFIIPQNWSWVRLKQVCSDFIVPQRDKPTAFGGNIPWCRIEDIEGKYLNGSKSNQLVTKELASQMNMHLCPKGTVICACSASIGNQAITTVECYTNQTFIGLVCDSRILYNEYLYYFFMSQKQVLRDMGKGTTISYISRKKFENYYFPLPPINEQKRIVAKIEQALASIMSI